MTLSFRVTSGQHHPCFHNLRARLLQRALWGLSLIVQKLLLVQNGVACLLPEGGLQDHITPVLQKLHWRSVVFRVQFEMLDLSYKALNGLGPTYPRDCFLLHVPLQSLRSAERNLLQMPPAHQVYSVKIYRRLF